jgi:hypothetical protein
VLKADNFFVYKGPSTGKPIESFPMTLSEALTYIMAREDDEQGGFTYKNQQDGYTYKKVLDADENIGGHALETTTTGITIELMGDDDDTERVIRLTGTGSLFTVTSKVTLKLGRNVTLKGKTNNDNALVIVGGTREEGGKLIMDEGSVITGNTSITNTSGGGVHVDDNGTFTMLGGTISLNATGGEACGGGVAVSNGPFIMSGGTISGNTTNNSGGGVYVGSGGTFKMSGGIISGNTVAAWGGGVWVSSLSSSFTKTGGIIYGSRKADGSAPEDATLQNKLTDDGTAGTAVCHLGHNPDTREKTLGPDDNWP